MAYDNAGNSTSNPFSYTTGGSHRILVVGIYLRGTSPTVTAATYNGVAMTLASAFAGAANSLYVYELVNPASGANNVAYTTNGGETFSNAVAVSLSGMNQVVHNNAATSQGASVTTVSTSFTPIGSPPKLEVINVIAALGVVASIAPNDGATTKTSVFSGNAPIGASYILLTAPTTVTGGWDRNDGNTNFMGEVFVGYTPLGLSVTTGSYSLGGQAAGLTAAHRLTASTLSLSFTLFSALLGKITGIINPTRHTATLSNVNRSTATLTNRAEHTATVANQAQH